MGFQLAPKSLEHTESENFFVYLCSKEIKESPDSGDKKCKVA